MEPARRSLEIAQAAGLNIRMSDHGARATLVRHRQGQELSCLLYDVHWDAEPGWVTWIFERPALCFLAEEMGGRAELRGRANAPCDGEYFGDGHLTFLAAGDPVTLYSSSLRQAQFACFVLSPQKADYLTAEQVASIDHAASRFMFQDERLRGCAQLLNGYEGDKESDAYALGLSRALLAALLVVLRPSSLPSGCRLTGVGLGRVLAYIIEHLDSRLTNAQLARVAEVAPTQFGQAFREATGLSPQRWQMDARVRLAQRLMIDNPEHSLSFIAMRSGFADQSHFSRAFLDIVGTAPAAWLHSRR